MSSLQEFLTLLLGAESEARRKTEDARTQAEEILTRARQDFQQEREARLATVRDQAKTLIEAAEKSTEAEIRQIQSMERQEAEGMAGRFRTHAADAVGTIIEETAADLIRKGTR
ncbi:MAG: ATPase [Thermovirgaceae bacterium]|nr:ATPase [Thermovirgaceae bacterium]